MALDDGRQCQIKCQAVFWHLTVAQVSDKCQISVRSSVRSSVKNTILSSKMKCQIKASDQVSYQVSESVRRVSDS